MQTMPPKMIVTRPIETGAQFARQVQDACGYEINAILAPGLKIVPLDVALPTQIDHVIFTSANGVAQAERLMMRPNGHAWCVGERTAQAAQALGFEVTVGGGDAERLVQTLEEERPIGKIVHVSGQHTRGNLAACLQSVGLDCFNVAAYDQIVCDPSADVITAMSGDQPLVIPLFSARSGLMLTQMEWRPRTHFVAISQNVADVASDWGADVVRIAAKPDENAMITATTSMLDQIKDGPSVA